MIEAAKFAFGAWLGWVVAPFVLVLLLVLALVAWAFFRVFVLEPIGSLWRRGWGNQR